MKFFGNAAVMLVALVILAGCSGGGRAGGGSMYDPTPYRERSFWVMDMDGGYTSEALGADRFKASVTGSDVTSQYRVMGIVLTRVAEMAREQGFDYIGLEKSESIMNCRSSVTNPNVLTANPRPGAEIIVRGGTLESLPADKMIFSIEKIEKNLRPAMLSGSNGGGGAGGIPSKNARQCSDATVGNYKRPWQIHDLLVRPTVES
ncbi:MAG: hypothetical protein AAFY01_12080 [Pseudomonadota bacterium]